MRAEINGHLQLSLWLTYVQESWKSISGTVHNNAAKKQAENDGEINHGSWSFTRARERVWCFRKPRNENFKLSLSAGQRTWSVVATRSCLVAAEPLLPKFSNFRDFRNSRFNPEMTRQCNSATLSLGTSHSSLWTSRTFRDFRTSLTTSFRIPLDWWFPLFHHWIQGWFSIFHWHSLT